jgi:hypothetical protein
VLPTEVAQADADYLLRHVRILTDAGILEESDG